MGFFTNLIGAAVDVVSTPVRVVQDVFDPAPGGSRTMDTLDSAAKKVEDAFFPEG